MTPSGERESSGPTRGDAWALLLLTLVCLLLRAPSLDAVALNPDESQYESSAAYLVATGSSAFEFPYGTPWTMTLYKGVAALFGPFSMEAVRLLVMLIAALTSWILYAMVSRAAGRGWGFVAGLLFLHVNQAFEGLGANREWFSFFPALVGIWLATRATRASGRRALLEWAIAGFVCGLCIVSKRQASFLVLVVPLWTLLRGRLAGAWWPRLRPLLPFLAGGLLAGAVFLLPFVVHGTADVYFGSLLADYSDFVKLNEAQTRAEAGGALPLYAHHLYDRLPHRGVFVLAYLFAGAFFWIAWRRRDDDGPRRELRETGLLFSIYLVLALGCVQLGNRFFDHYYLYAVAPLCALVPLGAHRFLAAGSDRTLRRVAWGVAAAFLIDRALGFSVNSWSAYRESGAAALPYLLFVVAALGALGWALARPSRRSGTLVALLVLLQVGMTVWFEQRRPVPRSFPAHPDAFAELTRRIHAVADPDDRIFVWGWLPEIYSAVRLEPASHMTITEYVVDDYYPNPVDASLNEAMAELLMDDLRERRPRFIVDGSARSWTMVAGRDPWLYDLERHPEFELNTMLREEYRRVGTYSGCVLYSRRR